MVSGPVTSRNPEGETKKRKKEIALLQDASSNRLSRFIGKVPRESSPTPSLGSLLRSLIDLIVKCFVKLLRGDVCCAQHWRFLKFYQGSAIKLVSHDLFFGWRGVGSPLLLAFSRQGSNVPASPRSGSLVTGKGRGRFRERGRRWRFDCEKSRCVHLNVQRWRCLPFWLEIPRSGSRPCSPGFSFPAGWVGPLFPCSCVCVMELFSMTLSCLLVRF